jgi:hypothetical protein
MPINKQLELSADVQLPCRVGDNNTAANATIVGLRAEASF